MPPINRETPGWCQKCATSRFKKVICDFHSPCRNCVEKGFECLRKEEDDLEIRENISSSPSIWTTFNPKLVQHYPTPIHFKHGNFGALNLVKNGNEGGEIIEFDWESNVEQREDLRITPNSQYEPTLVNPPTILPDSDEDDESILEESDARILNYFNTLNTTPTINPTILLNAVYSDRSSRKSIEEGQYPNAGNCLSLINLPGLSTDTNAKAGSSKVVWRTGDKHGRETNITSGAFEVLKAASREGSSDLEEEEEEEEEEAEESSDGCNEKIRKKKGSKVKQIPSLKGKERAIESDEEKDSDDDIIVVESQTNTTLIQSQFTPFEPASTSFQSSISPILQIQTAPLFSPNFSSTRIPTYLCATRSFTEVTLTHLTSTGLPISSTSSKLTSIIQEFHYPFRELGSNRYPISDLVLGGIKPNYGNLGSGMMIDLVGNLYGWGLDQLNSNNSICKGRKPQMFKLRKGTRECEEGGTGFARVVFGGARGLDAVVGFRDTVLLYDLRTAKASTTLVDKELLSRGIQEDQSFSRITSLLSASPASSLLYTSLPATSTPTSIHVVCTTRDIIWLDDRMPNRDLMRWEHGRAGSHGQGLDYTLEIMELNQVVDRDEDEDYGDETIERLVLHSKVHPQLSIYSYSTNVKSSPKSLLDPYSLPSPTPGYSNNFTRSGLAIVPALLSSSSSNATESGDKDIEQKKKKKLNWLIMESGEDGSVYSRFVTLKEERTGKGEEEILPPISIEERRIWSSEVIELSTRVGLSEDAEVGYSKGIRIEEEREKLDLKRVREQIFRLGEKGEEVPGKSEVVLGLAVEALKSIEEDEEVGDRGILTAFDLVALASEQLPSTLADGMDVDNDTPLSLEIQPLPRPSTFIHYPNTSKSLLQLDRLNRSLEVTTSLLSDASEWSSKLMSGNSEQKKTLRNNFVPDLPSSFDQMSKKSTELMERYAPVSVSTEDEWEDVEGEGEGRVEGEEEKEGGDEIVLDLSKVSNQTVLDATDRLILDLTLSSQVYSSRSITKDPLPSSLKAVNQPHPPKEPVPLLHFTFFQPGIPKRNNNDNEDENEDEMEDDEDDDDDDDDDIRGGRKKPSLKSLGARALLSEWHIGTNPKSYSWSNPYLGERKVEELVDTRRNGKKNKKRGRGEENSPPPSSAPLPSSQFVSTQNSARPPSTSFQNFTNPLRRISTIQEEFDNESSNGNLETASQPVFPIGFDSSSQSQSQSQSQLQGYGGASQIVPGAFGGRNLEKEKKKAKGKKRVSGF